MTLIAAIIVPLLAGSAVLQSPTPEELRWLESVSRASTPEERARLASREPDRIKPASLVRLASALRKASPRERGKWIEAGRGLLLIAEIGRDVEAHAHALWASARLAASPESKETAVGFYQQAIERFEECRNPHAADCMLESAELDVRYGGMIEQMTAQARFQRARNAFRQQARNEDEIRCLLGIAEAEVSLGNVVSAERNMAEAADLLRSPSDPRITGRAEHIRALIARERRYYSAALSALDRAKKSFVAATDDDGVARCHETAIWIYSAIGDREKQYREVESFLDVLEKIGEPWGIADGKRALADLWADVGRRDDAAKEILEAAAIYRRIGATLQVAQCDLTCGENYALNGRFGEAFRFLERARAVLEERKDLVGLSRYHLAMGTLLAEVGRPKEAIEMYQKAIPFFRQIRSKRDEAIAYLNASVSLRQLREFDRARACLDRALTLFDELGEVSDRALTLINLGQLHLRVGELELGKERLQEARRLYETVANPQKIAACDLALGWLAFRQGDVAEARKRVEQADPVLVETGDRARSVYSASLLARIARAQGQLHAAIQHYEHALARMEGIRSSIVDPVIAAGAVDDLARVSSDLAIAYLDAGKPEEAFAAAQRGKGVLLRQALLSARLQPEPTDQRDRQELRRLQVAYDLATGPAKERRLAELDAYWVQLRTRQPVFGKLDARPATLEAISKALPRDTAIAEYVLGSDEAAVLVLLPGSKSKIRPFRIHLSASEAAALADGILGADRDYSAWSARLHKQLIAPMAEALTGIKMVILCPDGPLHGVPYATLSDDKGRYFIENFALVVAPSASAWEACRSVAAKPRDRSKAGLLVARSEFGSSAPAGQALRGPTALPALPWVREEAQAIKRLLGKKVVELAEGQATVAAFRARSAGAPLLHFATHALPNGASPMSGALALAPAAADDPGFLYARDIYEMKLQAELAVLSACSTVQGRALAGEGLLGLGWAFLVAGCPNTIATRWDLGDRSGREWVEAFYRHRASGKAIADAYRAACLEAIRSKSFASPRQWGAWVLIGAG